VVVTNTFTVLALRLCSTSSPSTFSSSRGTAHCRPGRRTARRGGGDGVRRAGRDRRAVLVAARGARDSAGADQCRDGIADGAQPVDHLPQIGIALFVIGAGLGVAFAVANDVIIASVPPQNAGAAAGISETAYELGTALGIALLGSVIAGVYRNLVIPPGIHDDVAAHAERSLAAAHQAAETLDGDQAHALLAAAQVPSPPDWASQRDRLVLLLASAVAVWILLKPPPQRQLSLSLFR